METWILYDSLKSIVAHERRRKVGLSGKDSITIPRFPDYGVSPLRIKEQQGLTHYEG